MSPIEPPTVLVVDDEPLILHTAQRGLEAAGIVVWPASGGLEALMVLCVHRAQITVAVVDDHMPGQDGRATISALLTEKPSLRCCLMGGSLHEEAELFASGA